MKRLIAFILALVMVLSVLPANMIVAASAESAVVTVTADDARIHRSNVVTAPALEGGEYKMGIGRSDLWYDYNSRKVIPSIYNLRELMTVKVGTSSDKGINRYPYVVTKVNVKEAGYYDLGVKINMNAATAVNSLAIVVDGTVHVVHPEKTGAKQTVVAQDVYLTAGQHSILYTSVIPQNESEFSLSQERATFDTYYPWMNYWAFTFEGEAELEVLDASALTGTDVENIFKGSTRVEAEDTQLVSWNIYNKAESNGAASGDTVVGGPYYSQIKQTFADLTANGMDKAKTPCLQLTVEAPEAGTYFVTIGASIGTSTNNDNPVPYIAVIANDNAPVKAQFDGAWNGMDSVTVAVELEKGYNVIRWTSVTPDQYSEGTAWVNQDYIELQNGLTAKRAEVDAADEDYASYLYANRYAVSDGKFGGPNYADMWWDYPSLYEDMHGVYSAAKPERAGYWPYIAFTVNASRAGEYRISAKVATDATAKTIGMIVDGAMHVVDVTTTSGVLTQPVYLTAGAHTVIFTSPIPQDMGLIQAQNNAMYPWMDFYAFALDDGLVFGEAPTAETIQNSMENGSRVEAEDASSVSTNGNYAADISKSYTRRYFSPYTATVKAAAGAVIDGTVTAGEKLANTAQTFEELRSGKLDKALTSYVQYALSAPEAGTYVIRIGAYLEGSGTLPYGTVLVNGTAYKAQFGGSWNSYYAINLPVQLQTGENVIQLFGITADQTASDGWIGYDFVELPDGVTVAERRAVLSATDADAADYVYLNKYTISAGTFNGGSTYGDIRYDFPSLYEQMYGVYSDAKPERAGYWPYVALRVNAESAGYYEISAKVETSAGKTVGMIVDGAVHVVDIVSKEAAKSVYLTAGEHVIIFTVPMFADMVSRPTTTGSSSQYPWLNYFSFNIPAGLQFAAAPTVDDIKASMQNYSRIEAEDSLYANANGSFAANISKDYTTRYFNPYTATVKGAAGAAIDAAATAEEKLANSTQTFAQLQAGDLDKALTSYVQYVVNAPQAGTYTIRVGAYLEGSGTMPYGTVLVNGVAYKAQFAGNWNGYYAVNLPVKLNAGKNSIQLIGITADQTASDGWIGYDFIDLPQGLGAELLTVSAAAENWDAYLYLNRYKDGGSSFGDPDNNIYPDMRWDFPSLYEDMYGIYSAAKPARAGYWPYIAFTVNAPQAGEYRISTKITTNANAKTIGMIVDGSMYVIDVTTTSGTLTQSVYLTAGAHTVIFTSPIPQDMGLIQAQNNALYPWFDFSAFTLNDGLTFGEVPTAETVQNSMKSDFRMEAEDFAYAVANGNYAADVSKSYTRRYFSPYIATVKGAAGAVIDGTVTADEKLVNSAQTYTELLAGGLDEDLTSYVQFAVTAPKAGTYVIRVGAYLEGSGTMPYATVLVNGTAYKAPFGGSWNSYYAVNLPVQLCEGTNTIQLVGITADQEADGWIGYDFVDIPDGVAAGNGRKEVGAADEDWADYVYLNRYQDKGSNFGGPNYADLWWDYPSLYEEMSGIYSNAMPDRAGYWPYIALRVAAEEAGYYQIGAQIQTSAAEVVGMIVDGAMYDVNVVSNAVTESVYLTAGEHVIIFTPSMPRDMTVATTNDSALYPWINYCSFKVDAALSIIGAPTFAQIKASLQNYSRVEAEDATSVAATGGYINETTKTYVRQYGNMAVEVKGQAGSVGASDYVGCKLYAAEAGTYVIRIGAYLEGSGDMPYGTVVVNGTTYKAQFSGSWIGYDAVNVAVQLQEGENIVQLFGVSADQTATDGWIGYDFLEAPKGLCFYEAGEYTQTATDKGFAFEKRTTYETSGTISHAPYSISAWIYLPTGYMTRGGVIFGNYMNSNTPYANFEISENGVPRFAHINGEGKNVDLYFDKVNVCVNAWTNITFTISGNSVSCYKNGVLAQTVTAENDIDLTAVKNPYVLGGDLRASADGNPNGQYFKGRIIDVALFDTALSVEEVLNVYSDADANETKPFTRYKLENAEIKKDIADEKGNNKLFVETPYYDKAPASDYAYSFAVVGDTQIVTENDAKKGQDNLSKLYDWILENRESKNIQFVFGLGDITDNNTVEEWEIAQAQMQKLDAAGVAYSVVRGNHELVGRNDPTNTDFMTQYLGSEAYKNQFAEGGFYDENISNSWRTLTVGEVKYLMIALDFGPSDELLAWAGEIIEAHPDHSVIITTHAYLYRDGTTLDENDAAAPSGYGFANNGDDIWEKLVSKYENVLMVLSGHDPSDNIIVSRDTGVNGNVVTSMLIDPQGIDNEDGSTGMLAMLYFSEDGKTVQVEYLSTVRAAEKDPVVYPVYFREENQFTFTLVSEDETVYVDAVNGNDMAIGTASAPVKTLEKALRFIAPNGKIVIVGDYAVADNFAWVTNGAVTVTGGKLDFSAQSTVSFGEAVTFDDIELVFADGAEVYFNGYKAKISENVTVTGLTTIFGGSKTGTIASTDLTVLSGTYQTIYGGSGGVKGATTKITGEAKLVVGGNVNADIDVADHSLNYNIHGGSRRGSVGSTNVTVNGNAKANMVYGGGSSSHDGGDWCDFGTTNVTINGGSFMGIYGGNTYGPSLENSNVNITINGGTMEQVFGGHEGANDNLKGNVNITLNGGTITRRVYGGSYNNCGLSFDTDRHVVGNITLTITSGVNIDFSYSGQDKSIYAHSRHNAPSAEEDSTIVFASYAAYVKYGSKLGAQDSTMQLIMGNIPAADNIIIPEAPADGIVETENGYYLEKDVTVSELTVEAGKTLDLNGYTLTVDSLACFGSVVDTSEGTTGKLIATNMTISDMTYMPIYDSANGWYKFYAYELVNLGVRSTNGGVIYGFSIAFENADAYALLASSGEAGLDVVMTLNWGENEKSFAFGAELLQQYAALQAKYPALRSALMLTVTGLEALESGTALTVTPAVMAGQLSVTGEEMVYTVA